MFRYIAKLEQHDRFAADVRFSIQHTARKRVGVDLFHFWDDVLRNNRINDEEIKNVSQFYDIFKQELSNDLAQSARI